MGFNIAGIVISDNYNKDLDALAEDVNLKLKVTDEISYETASANWTPEGEFRVYFSESATLIYFNHAEASNSYHSKIHDSMSFAYSATAMVFNIEYFEKGKLVRSMWEMEGDRESEYGNALPEEEENPTADGLIFALIDRIMGESFMGVDGAEVAYKCRRVN